MLENVHEKRSIGQFKCCFHNIKIKKNLSIRQKIIAAVRMELVGSVTVRWVEHKSSRIEKTVNKQHHAISWLTY